MCYFTYNNEQQPGLDHNVNNFHIQWILGAKLPGNVSIPKAWAKNVHVIHYPLKNGNVFLAELLVDSYGQQNTPHGNGASWLSLGIFIYSQNFQFH